MTSRWMSIVEYARYHNISDMTVRRRIKNGKLHAILKEGKYFIQCNEDGSSALNNEEANGHSNSPTFNSANVHNNYFNHSAAEQFNQEARYSTNVHPSSYQKSNIQPQSTPSVSNNYETSPDLNYLPNDFPTPQQFFSKEMEVNQNNQQKNSVSFQKDPLPRRSNEDFNPHTHGDYSDNLPTKEHLGRSFNNPNETHSDQIFDMNNSSHRPSHEIPKSIQDKISNQSTVQIASSDLLSFCESILKRADDVNRALEVAYKNKLEATEQKVKTLENEIAIKDQSEFQLRQKIEDLQMLLNMIEGSN